MRKISLMMIALISVITFSGCQDDEEVVVETELSKSAGQIKGNWLLVTEKGEGYFASGNPQYINVVVLNDDTEIDGTQILSNRYGGKYTLTEDDKSIYVNYLGEAWILTFPTVSKMMWVTTETNADGSKVMKTRDFTRK